MTKVIAVTNYKGGVGKTTTAATLAHGLSLFTGFGRRLRVAIVDLDPQGNQADQWGVRPRVWSPATPEGRCVSYLFMGQKSIAQCAVSLDRPEDGLHRSDTILLPASRRMAALGTHLVANEIARASAGLDDGVRTDDILSHYLAPLIDRVDYIVIDTPPGVGPLKASVYNFADYVIVPVETKDLALVGCIQHTNDHAEHVRRGAKAQLLYVLPTMFSAREVAHRNVLAQLVEVFGRGRVAEPIPRSAAVAEASARGGRTIFESTRQDNPALVSYNLLVEGVISKNER